MNKAKNLWVVVTCLILFSFGFSKETSLEHSAFQKQANIIDDHLYTIAQEDDVKFWERCAQNIDWFSLWDEALQWDPPYAKWFASATLNVSYNCLDRHILAGKGDKLALAWSSECGRKSTWTYQKLYEEVCQLSNVLKDLGVKKGDKVAIYMPMVPEAIASMLACARIGAVHSVIFGGIGAQSVKDRVDDADASLLITADGSYRAGKVVPYKEKIDPILASCPTLKKVLVLKHTNEPSFLLQGRDFFYHEMMAKASKICPPEVMGAEDPLFILYTSGTTGKPKGILHTTGGYLVGVNTTFRWVFDIKENDVYWCTADIGWITGHSFVTYGPLSCGVSQVIYEGAFEYPNVNQFSKIIDENRVSIFYTAPTLVRTFMKWGESCIKDSSLSSLRLLGTIGEPINPESWMWFHDVIGKKRCPIVDTWFQTETGALVISPIPGLTKMVPGSVTKALPGYDVEVLDMEGNPAERGLLAIRKPFPSMMRGVYKNPERYKATYWSQWDGKYYFAGDAAHKDKEGNIWIGGRCDEVLKVSGHRIGTSEVENALIEHHAVSESAVVGVKDCVKGEKIIAFVILKDDVKKNPGIEEEIRKKVAEVLGAYARPERVILVDKLPKTRSGKILRRILKNLIEGAAMGSIVTLSDPSCIDELSQKCQALYEEFYPESLLQKISDAPILKDLELEIKEGTCKALQPFLTSILQQHLASTNYDRLHMVAEFLAYYDACGKTVSALSALSAYTPSIDLQRRRGSSCYGLCMELMSRLPKTLQAVYIPAELGTRFRQKGWSTFSHVAIAIACEDGWILLDPNFDIEVPIALPFSGEECVVDMKNKGVWVFRLQGNKIHVSASSADPQWNTVYELKEYLNFVDVGIKPMIIMDKKPCIIARDEKGCQQAYVSVNLEQQCIMWSVGYDRMPVVSFDDFMERKFVFDEQFCRRLSISSEDLHETIAKVILGQKTLAKCREVFNELLASQPEAKGRFYE